VKKTIVNIHQIPILVYHKIQYRKEFGVNSIHPRQFRQQIRSLKERGYQAITFRDIFFGHDLPGKPIMITFDDGYECVFKHAFPILKEENFPAVVFVISGFIGKKNTWDVNLGGLTFRHLDTEQILTLRQSGWEIGSHSVTHRALPYLNTKQIKTEMVASKQSLEKLLKEPIISLAFPFGFSNKRTLRLAYESGYKFVLTGQIPDLRNEIHSSFSILKRIPVYQTDSISELLGRLSFNHPSGLDKFKIYFLSAPRRFTPIYQLLFKRELFLENY